MSSRLRAAVLGATGVAGQQFLATLHDHPDFVVTKVAASERSAGKAYLAAISDASGKVNWFGRQPLDDHHAKLRVENAADMTADGVDIVFSALDAEPARSIEARLAADLPVISTASAYRYEADIPIFLPAVNLEHAPLIDVQRKKRGWKGFITPGPNCTTTGLVLSLAPLQNAFGIERVIMTSMQAVSGAGRSPGVAALDIIDNVVPYIAKEEEKVERETKKILGQLAGETITDASVTVSCTCMRVNVLEGHTESVFVSLKKQASLADIKHAMETFGREFVALELPSSPQHLLTVLDDPYRPQPRLDRDREDGMTTTIGRLRVEPVLGGVKYVLVSHNTQMGAAKGAVLIAEYLRHTNYIK